MSKVTMVEHLEGETEEETRDLAKLAKTAKAYLASFRWCGGIKEEYAGLTIPGIVGVFLFRIVPGSPDTDEWLWVVVGDLPPAYITLDSSPNPATGLDAYIGAMREWVDAVKNNLPTEELIPVNTPATIQYAEMLESRLDFLESEVLSDYSEDLKAH